MYKKYGKQDQRLMAAWAADCAERVLPLFEKAFPNDARPRKAIEECRTWLRTGVFKMAVIRGASLAAHAAARQAEANSAACFAARAAGQAVATAHVPQHAFGAIFYALKAVAAAGSAQAGTDVAGEWDWELQRVSDHLREEVLKRVIVQNNGDKITIKIHKGRDF
jgi:hypothetical protein